MATTNPPLKLKTAISLQRPYSLLRDGTVSVPGVELDHVDAPSYVDIFRRMARTLEFDVAEMSLVSYLCAKDHGIAFSAIPVVLRSLYHHGDFLVNVNASIEEPKDFEGKQVGSRTYTVTPGVLDRGILSDEFGVDVDKVTWVLGEPEHVPQCQAHLPANVIAGTGEDLFPRLASGDLDAGIAGSNLNRQSSPNVQPLFPNASELDKAYYQRTGIVQPFTIVVVKDTLLDTNPWLAESLYDGFKRAKAIGFDVDKNVAEVVGDGDPLPYGFEANRKAFEEVARLAYAQHVTARQFSVEELLPRLD